MMQLPLTTEQNLIASINTRILTPRDLPAPERPPLVVDHMRTVYDALNALQARCQALEEQAYEAAQAAGMHWRTDRAWHHARGVTQGVVAARIAIMQAELPLFGVNTQEGLS